MQRKGRPSSGDWCSQCGEVQQWDGARYRPCPTHPSASVVKKDRRREYALFYLRQWDEQGLDLHVMSERLDEAQVHPGTTKADLAMMLAYGRKWGLIKELPPAPMKLKIYGGGKWTV